MRKLKNAIHFLEAVLANIWYGFPSKELTVIGVTGTDGKTTTTSLIYHILKTNGKKVAMITSIGAYIGDTMYDIGFHVTTPSSFGIQKYLRKAVSEGNEYVVLETTSHALDQYRVWGVAYTVGVLTNITHEHLDYHRSYEAYVEAKMNLLQIVDTVVVNADDDSYRYILPNLLGKTVISYSLKQKSATLTPTKFPFTTKLIGSFNTLNALAAIGVARSFGLPDAEIKTAVATFIPPSGRQEVVYNKSFMVMVDFAHTPNAFVQLLPELAKRKKGRLIHVFGSAGLRDATKRPLMGKASSASADVIILTVEDPRTESLGDINRAILTGIPGKFIREDWNTYRAKVKDKKMVFIIEDRKKAIHFAINLAKKGDIVVITGKGHEKSMNYGNGEVAWDEFAIVRDALKS